MNEECGCCEGVEKITPIPLANRPSLDALTYRVGTHAEFLATMQARLTNYPLDTGMRDAAGKTITLTPLDRLKTRETDDPAMALLDAWATVADVLTFYQERIANEGYLRTATERRSVLELAALIGYAPRPGVASSVYLAYTLDKGDPVTITAGSRAQSVPGPGETAQAFETSDDLDARADWNTLPPRMSRPQRLVKAELDWQASFPLYLQGTATKLSVGAPLLLDFGREQALYRVTDVQPQHDTNQTQVTLETWNHTFTLPVNRNQGASLPQRHIIQLQQALIPVLKQAIAAPSGVVPNNATYKAVLSQLKRVLAELTLRATFNATTSGTGTESVEAPVGEDASAAAAAGEGITTAIGEGDSVGAVSNATGDLPGSAAAGGVDDATTLRTILKTLDQTFALLDHDVKIAGAHRSVALTYWLQGVTATLTDAVRTVLITADNEGEPISLVITPPATDAGSPFAVASHLNQIKKAPNALPILGKFLDPASGLAKPASVPPPNALRLDTNIKSDFGANRDIAPSLLTTLRPALADTLYKAWETVPVTPAGTVKVYALRVTASLFGHNAPKEPRYQEATFNEGTTRNPNAGQLLPQSDWFEWALASDESRETLYLDGAYSQILPGSFVVVLTSASSLKFSVALVHGSSTSLVSTAGTAASGGTENTISPIHRCKNVLLRSRSAYGLSAKTTQITLTEAWREQPGPNTTPTELFTEYIRPTTVFAQSELLELAEEPMNAPICGGQIELDGLYDGLKPGRWLIVSGERVVEGTGTAKVATTSVSNSPAEGKSTIFGGISVIGEETAAVPALSGASGSADLSGVAAMPAAVEAQDVVAPTALSTDAGPGTTAIAPTVVTGKNAKSGRQKAEATTETAAHADVVTAETATPRPTALTANASALTTDTHMPQTIAPLAAVLSDGSQSAVSTNPATTVVPAAELVMLAGVEHGNATSRRPGETTHSTLFLATPLAYCYKRATIAIYGNVAKATHGETRGEVLGSGDGGKPLQQFTLKQSPLTYISAPTPSGVASTLQVRVNDLLWHETDSLAGLQPQDRAYVTNTGDDGKTTLTFGDGVTGARPPSGQENIKAAYRSGIGKPGDVRAGQISQLATRPLGVKAVVNPLPATGGADREDRDQARENAPLAVTALDRLVSTRDYEDFTRTFGGIGKASAALLTDGRRQIVHLSVAGADDIPLDLTSDVYQNLKIALARFGDPHQAVQIAVAKRLLLVVCARVRLLPDYIWEAVAPKIRAALLSRFQFRRRALGQSVSLSEVISVIQQIDGVDYVMPDFFDAIDEDISLAALAALAQTLKLKMHIAVSKATIDPSAATPARRILPAQIAFLSPDLPDTLLLTELTDKVLAAQAGSAKHGNGAKQGSVVSASKGRFIYTRNLK